VDIQAAPPSIPMSLSRVGLTGVEKVVHIGVDRRSPQLFSARLECFIDLGPGQRGAHMSRFEEVINDAVRELFLGDAGMRAGRLAQQVAERVRERQDARRAMVTIAARFPERRPAPVSGTPTQEISTLYGTAVASERGTRRMVGVSAQGMTTSPYAQDVLTARAREHLARGFSEAQIARIVDAVPVATDSRLGVGTLHLGCPEDCALEFDVAALLAIVEAAMSSEIFELLKRSDEAAVVERAHRRPRFVEDCVRAMIAAVVDRFAGVPDDVFVSAAQENSETAHGHDVIAERAGLLGDLRRELATGRAVARWTSMAEWLEAS
jgi:GTP cyclohydrolase I/GTP cyclohydrolase-4